ncbi:MAG TPA: hypothetical protein VEA81_17560 [Burkholderiaceae bacterium]|nr:hypothetical protein [Burkholderiaceae bacterium]
MASDRSAAFRPKWDAVVLVCRACRKRRDVPAALAGKAVARTLREALRDLRPRPRIVLSSCLGVCPKKALALAAIGAAGTPLVVSVTDEAGVDAAAALLGEAIRPAR